MLKIIAEIGINHNGNFDYIYELIRQASIGGADLIKFQLYTSKLVFGDNSRKHNEFTFKQVEKIQGICNFYNVEFFASVFDEEKLEWCEQLDVKRYKIASRTWENNKEFVEQVLSKGKPTYVSLGMANIQHTLSYGDIKFFNCISKYPTTFEDLTKEKFIFDDFVIGWSDHFYGISACLYAIAKGAKMVEKHFTLDKPMGPHRDHIGSMDLKELKMLNTHGRELWRTQNAII